MAGTTNSSSRTRNVASSARRAVLRSYSGNSSVIPRRTASMLDNTVSACVRTCAMAAGSGARLLQGLQLILQCLVGGSEAGRHRGQCLGAGRGW